MEMTTDQHRVYLALNAQVRNRQAKSSIHSYLTE